MRRIIIILMTLVLVGTVVWLSVYSLSRYSRCVDRGQLVSQRVELIRGISPMLDTLETEIWGVISVYDPTKKAKVDFTKFDHARIINRIIGKIDEASGLTDNDDLSFQIDMLRRSVHSLAKRTDAIKEKLELKKMDEESTQVLFSDAEYGTSLSVSYVDEMEKITEQIRFAKGVINKNIDKYTISEFLQQEKESSVGRAKLTAMKSTCLIAGAVACLAAVFLLVAAYRIKD